MPDNGYITRRRAIQNYVDQIFDDPEKQQTLTVLLLLLKLSDQELNTLYLLLDKTIRPVSDYIL